MSDVYAREITSGAFQRLRRLSQSARTHVTHRMRARTQITWTWLCTRGKKRYKYCSFSHTNRSFRVLGHQCVVTMGNCLIWISSSSLSSSWALLSFCYMWDIQWNEMSCLTGPRCYINTDIQHYKPIHKLTYWQILTKYTIYKCLPYTNKDKR